MIPKGDTAFDHLQRMCWNASIWFGEWPHVSTQRRLQMCRDITNTYLEFRRIPRENAEPWVWEAIDGLHPELAGLIAESLPPAEYKRLMRWMNEGIRRTQNETKRIQEQLNDLPF